MSTANTTEDHRLQARAFLENAYKNLLAASKVAVGNDGHILMAAAAAVDVAVEALTPPHPEIDLAANSCREALELARRTRVYAQGGNIANALEPARRTLERSLKLLEAT